MAWIGDRLKYLFTSTKGLILTAIALISLVSAIWGTLSGPMVEWGVRDITVNLLGMDLEHVEREGRLVILYHSIAMAVVAVLVYLITHEISMKKSTAAFINGTVTAGYMMAMFFGLGFGYFGHNWTFHGLYLVGLSLVFFAGCVLAVALWPFRKEYLLKEDSDYARGPGNVDMERMAFFVMAVCTLGSAMLGAWSGSYFGNGFETFLAEDTIREPHKSYLDLAVIGHLHIMLTLIGIATTLLIGRWFDFKGILHKIAMPLMIWGTIVITGGAWGVVPWEPIAHNVIYFGATFSMLGALMLVIYGLPKITRDRLEEQGIEKATRWQKLMALLHDPLKFGSLWQMIFMNFTVSGVGIFMAVTLEETMRVWPWRDERITLTGHWHILSTLTATILLFRFADMMGLKGKIRQWFGWIIILASDLAFEAVTIFELKRLFVDEYHQQPVVNWTMLLTDIGLGAILVLLGAFMTWLLIDLLRNNGAWKKYMREIGIPLPSEQKSSGASQIAPSKEVSQ